MDCQSQLLQISLAEELRVLTQFWSELVINYASNAGLLGKTKH